MGLDKCTFPNCDCKTETVAVDNSSDFMVPNYTGDFEQTTYTQKICKWN